MQREVNLTELTNQLLNPKNNYKNCVKLLQNDAKFDWIQSIKNVQSKIK